MGQRFEEFTGEEDSKIISIRAQRRAWHEKDVYAQVCYRKVKGELAHFYDILRDE
jgi:hypothetical protein